MKKVRNMLITLTALCFGANLGALPLEKGTLHRNVDGFTNEQKFRLWDFEDWAANQGLQGFQSIIAYFENDEMMAVLSRDFNLGLIDTDAESYLGNWPLTRWVHEPIEPEVLQRFEEVRVSYGQLRMKPTHALGCLNATPLRYGDINQDGMSELVMFIGNQLMVFSPDTQKIVFSLNMRVDDWMNEEETGWHFEYYPVGGDESLIPYYQSAANMDLSYELPGYRGYGKIYLGDFEEAEQQDILVWRKLYLSRTLTSVRGFEKVSDTFYHYRKSDTGEYQPVDTDEATIQEWLATKELTWSQGYPRYSECEGEEGQLIPEMHDALLNDPDVLM